MTEVESRFKEVPVFIAASEDIYSGKLDQDSFTISYVNMQKKQNYSDFKRRMVDILEAQGRDGLK